MVTGGSSGIGAAIAARPAADGAIVANFDVAVGILRAHRVDPEHQAHRQTRGPVGRRFAARIERRQICYRPDPGDRRWPGANVKDIGTRQCRVCWRDAQGKHSSITYADPADSFLQYLDASAHSSPRNPRGYISRIHHSCETSRKIISAEQHQRRTMSTNESSRGSHTKNRNPVAITWTTVP